MKTFSIALGWARAAIVPTDAPGFGRRRDGAARRSLRTQAGSAVGWLLLAILAISVGAGGAIATFGQVIGPY